MNPYQYRLDLLKWELDSIQSSIRKMDDLGNNTKKWSIVTWIGAIAVLLREPDLHKYIHLTIMPPLLFMLVDAHWRKLQRRFVYRMNKISQFINSSDFDKACASNDLSGFNLLDPFSRLDKTQVDLQKYISIKRILRYPTISLLYIGQALISLLAWLMLNFI